MDTKSTANSSKETTSRLRSKSDAMPRPLGGIARPDPTTDYKFTGMLPSNAGGPKAPKRNTLAGLRSSLSSVPNAMAEVVRSTDLGGYSSSRRDSNSPQSRFGRRANSPISSIFSKGSVGNAKDTSMLALDDGTMVDKNSAYRRLSDANLARSGGVLSKLSKPVRSHSASGGKRSLTSPRLEKDYLYGDGEDAVESSDEEALTTDEEDVRGRRKGDNGKEREWEDTDPEAKTLGMGKGKGPRKTLSLMAAADEESKYSHSSFKYHNLTLVGYSSKRTIPGQVSSRA